MSDNKEKDVFRYESPDAGDTIYRIDVRTGNKILVKGRNAVFEMIQENLEDTSELESLRQQVLNLTMANAELKDMLRNAGVDIV